MWLLQISSLSVMINDQKHILYTVIPLKSSTCLWPPHANDIPSQAHVEIMPVWAKSPSGLLFQV